MIDIRSPLHAQVVAWLVTPGAEVAVGDVLLILEAMKMEHEVRAPVAGRLGNKATDKAHGTTSKGSLYQSTLTVRSVPFATPAPPIL